MQYEYSHWKVNANCYHYDTCISSLYLNFLGMNIKHFSKICFWGKCKVRYNLKGTIASSWLSPFFQQILPTMHLNLKLRKCFIRNMVNTTLCIENKHWNNFCHNDICVISINWNKPEAEKMYRRIRSLVLISLKMYPDVVLYSYKSACFCISNYE